MTPNKEDYLKCIYEIGSRHKKITNKEIAQLMQVSPPAVTEMMKKMLAEELLVKDKKAGYLLTDLGLRLVSDLYRKHRLIEVFLVNHLGYSTDEIHEEAEVLEHTVSERFVERLDAMLQYPKTCPHGGTIPAKGELLDEENQLTLEEASAPGDYIIKRVHDDFDLLKYLEKYNLQIGQTITLIQYDSFAQVYFLKTETQEIQINPMIAQQIYVEKL
ncbi:metal-dependent transcriptional regulator [Streptococcus sanguinis]|uniref:Manganese transport regulator n=1 Tax=Streptococcus sanguinis TaxID=1305 RepID=A0A2X3VA08_STRSA|nr:metal-dependent transcriptional regulator [Streptococcus sanguinis]EGJ42624.1 iron-dependent repressor [Streptococcus sanguinis SK1059]EGQ18808.1 iron-dependent repressor [Streptococcus sanguinis ATCC 29667]EGQ25253.1 iron-dependent repressor [Streptococcus sanguinis SK340]SQF36158.1 Fe/Mn-dependent transcriptional repressor ScaR [Streptococcus sanguinis]